MKKVASLILLTFIVISSYFCMSVIDRSTMEYNRDATVFINIDDFASVGTGVHLGNGYVLSANHVTATDKAITVSTFNKPEDFKSFELVAADEVNDISVIKTDDSVIKNLPTVTLECSLPSLGEDVYNIGHSLFNKWVAFYGKIAATNHIVADDKTYVINISNTQGSSGGGFFDSDGHLVGIVSLYRGAADESIAYITLGMHYPARPVDICKFLNDNGIVYNQPLISSAVSYITDVTERIRYAGISGWWKRT